MTQRRSYLVIALAIIVMLFMGCATFPVRSHKLNCADYASAAGHAYEHIWAEPAFICVGKRKKSSKVKHAQAYTMKGGRIVWLGLYSESLEMPWKGRLVLDVPRELDIVNGCMPLVEFDERVKWRLN